MKINLLKMSVIFTILNFISKLVGLLRDILIANTYGVSAITDAYNIALTVPNILYMVCASAIMITFIPNLYEVEEQEGLEGAYKFINKFSTILLIISVLFYILGMKYTEYIVTIIAPNLEYSIFRLTIKLTRITLINLIFTVITTICTSVLRSKNKYIGTSIMPIMANLPVILILIFNINSNNIVWLTTLSSVGLILQFMALLPELKSINFKVKFTLKGYNNRIFDIFKKMLPMMFGLAITQISLIVDKNIGSRISEGVITSLDLSSKITNVIYGILNSTMITIFTPILAKQFINEDKSEWVNTINKIIRYMLLFTIPIAVGLFVLNENIISVLYGRGNFTQDDVRLMSVALVGYLIQLPFLTIRDVLGQGFYSTKNTKTPAINGMIAIVLNIILTIIFSQIWGVFGITLATSISLIFSSGLLLYAFKNNFNDFRIKDVVYSLIKIIIISLVMGIIILIVKLFIGSILNNFTQLIVLTIIGILSYIILCYLFKVNEINEILILIRKKSLE